MDKKDPNKVCFVCPISNKCIQAVIEKPCPIPYENTKNKKEIK